MKRSKVERYHHELWLAALRISVEDRVTALEDRPWAYQILPRPKFHLLFSEAASEIAPHPLADRVLSAMEEARDAFFCYGRPTDCPEEQQRLLDRLGRAIDVLAGYLHIQNGKQRIDVSALPQGQQDIIAVVLGHKGGKPLTKDLVIAALAKLTGAEVSRGVTGQHLAELTRNDWLVNNRPGYSPGPKLGPS